MMGLSEMSLKKLGLWGWNLGRMIFKQKIRMISRMSRIMGMGMGIERKLKLKFRKKIMGTSIIAILTMRKLKIR